MKAEYDTWYPCEKGSMPEDFENLLCTIHGKTCYTLICYLWIDKDFQNHAYRSLSYGEWNWHGDFGTHLREDLIKAWMIPHPYEE